MRARNKLQCTDDDCGWTGSIGMAGLIMVCPDCKADLEEQPV